VETVPVALSFQNIKRTIVFRTLKSQKKLNVFRFTCLW